MQKQNLDLHLPQINRKHFSPKSVNRALNSCTVRLDIRTQLKEIKLKHLFYQENQSLKVASKFRKAQETRRLYQQSNRKQIKRLVKERSLIDDQPEQLIPDKIQPTVTTFRYETDWKPPHRYKTTIGIHDDNIILYGGLGCQKYISWAKFSIKSQQWTNPPPDQDSHTSIYGHSMCIYKGGAYVFGGSRQESSTNELTYINLKNMKSTQLPPAPHRRKQHAMSFFSRYLIIHGGIQSSNQTKNTLFYFDTESEKWTTPLQFQIPFLSHHSMVSIPNKIRKRYSSFQDILRQSVYMFGGLNQNAEQSSKFLRLRVKQGGQIAAQQIIAACGPEARHSHCMQYIEPSYICIYGGRNNDELTDLNKNKGVFSDIYLFDLELKAWVIPTINRVLQPRFGGCSCSFKNRMFIFGGNGLKQYADGNILEIQIKDSNLEKDEEGQANQRTTNRLKA